MSKHTPGPWRSNEDEPDGYKFIISEQSNGLTNDGYVICEVFGYTDETIANINLIKAAPAMFDFINEFIDVWESGMAGDSYLLRDARKLVSKVEVEI